MRATQQYPKDLAEHVYRYLVSHQSFAPSVSVEILETLFENLFFASLRREEGEAISCRVAFMQRDNPDPYPPQRIVADRWQAVPFSKDMPFSVPVLVKLSKAADPWASTLAVDVNEIGELRIWGLVDQSVHYSAFVVKEANSGPQMPGLFQASIHGVGEVSVYSTYTFIGTLRQQTLIIDQPNVFETGPIRQKLDATLSAYRSSVRSHVSSAEYEYRGHWDASLDDIWLSTLCRLLIGIKRYGHGGALLLSNVDEGLESKYAIQYLRLKNAHLNHAVNLIRSTLASDTIFYDFLDRRKKNIPTDLYLEHSVGEDSDEELKDEITGSIRFISSLSRVDGLVWMSSDLALNGFGVEIKTSQEPANVCLASDSDAKSLSSLDLNEYGTRHRSMFRYCYANPESVGFVVSQDGDVRAVTRVDDKVVFWENIRLHHLEKAESE